MSEREDFETANAILAKENDALQAHVEALEGERDEARREAKQYRDAVLALRGVPLGESEPPTTCPTCKHPKAFLGACSVIGMSGPCNCRDAYHFAGHTVPTGTTGEQLTKLLDPNAKGRWNKRHAGDIRRPPYRVPTGTDSVGKRTLDMLRRTEGVVVTGDPSEGVPTGTDTKEEP